MTRAEFSVMIENAEIEHSIAVRLYEQFDYYEERIAELEERYVHYTGELRAQCEDTLRTIELYRKLEAKLKRYENATRYSVDSGLIEFNGSTERLRNVNVIVLEGGE